MNIPFFHKKGDPVGVHNSYAVTPLGKQKAEEYVLGGSKGEVLGALAENSPSNPKEISESEGVHLSPEQVKKVINVLIRDGYVRPSGKGD